MSGFDALSPDLALLENHFLEASAGTGKTFAIEHIFLRLLLEDNGPSIDQILVVTFTKAATYELKQRIRKTLEKAVANPENYPFLKGKNLYLIKKKLLRAASLFDDAKIMTIHSFCFHGLHLDQIEPNEKKESRHVEKVKDYLRTELHQFPSFQIDKLLRKYQFDIDKLIKDLLKIALKRAPILCGRPFSELERSIACEIDAFRKIEPIKEKIFHDLLQLAPCYKGFCNRKKEVKEEALEEFQRFSTLFEEPFDLFSFSNLLMMREENRLQKELPTQLNYPSLYKKILPLLDEGNDTFIIFATLAEGVRKHLENDDKVTLHDDFLLLMEKKLENEEFCAKIRNSYKAVLIDEFQDTDRIQWKIFSRLFLNHVPLYLIGDPKQSIYRFRGADIYTYMEAKKSMATHETLSRNYRAQKPLVDCLNKLFSADDPFLILPKTKEALNCPRIDFDPAKEITSFDDGKASIHFLLGEEESDFFPTIIDEIITIKNKKNIALKEFAVLVKDRYQAERFQDYARKRNIAAVTTRSRSLIESKAYPALKELLVEIGQLKKKGALEKILGGAIFSYPIDEIEMRKNEMAMHLFALHERLLTQGILSFFNMLMEELHCYETILLKQDGVEFYADLLQLVEILLESKMDYLACLNKLEESRDDGEELLSYSIGTVDGIKIMTIHGSKGLEFDVVFALGLSFASKLRKELIFEPENHAFTFSKEKMEKEALEIRCEKIRLFYVAATRARKRLYLPYIEKEKEAPISIFLKDKNPAEFLPEITHSFCDGKQRDQAFEIEKNNLILFSPCTKKIFYPQINITSFTALAQNTFDLENQIVKSGLPAGKETGHLLHTIFEKLSFHQPIETIVASHLEKTPYKIWENEILEIVKGALLAPFPVNPAFTLRDIDPKKIIKEREFLYFSKTQGYYLKGFIDCIIEYENKIYLIDWKSNSLEDYSLQSMEKEMKKHDYFLQEKIYREALLQYSPSLNFGGSFYFFIRGNSIYAIP